MKRKLEKTGRFVITAALCLVLLTSLFACEKKGHQPIKTGMVAPNPGALYLGEEQAVDLRTYRGKPLVLLFFSNSCCADELDKFEKISKEPVRNFAILGINVGDPLEEVTKITAEKKLSFRLASDPLLTANHRYQLVGLPTIFVLDKDGIVLQRMIGKMSYVQLKKEIILALASSKGKS